MCSELPTATFLFLPNWENKIINAYRALVRDNPKVTMVTMGGDLQPGCLADRLLTGLGQPQITP